MIAVIYTLSSLHVQRQPDPFKSNFLAASNNRLFLPGTSPSSHEVAGEHASYFQAETPNVLAVAIKFWLVDCNKDTR